MKVRGNLGWMAGVILLVTAGSTTAWAVVGSGTPPPPASAVEDCPTTPRGETPFPFCEPNTRYELADGESYELPGTLMVNETGKVQFQINLTRVPHLANNTRKASPYFRMVQGPLADRAIREYANREVMVSVIARSRVATASDTGELRPEIFLELVKLPEAAPRVGI